VRIKRYRQVDAADAAYTVTGPEYEHRFTTESAAIATALDQASRSRGATFYVRIDGEIILWAESNERGSAWLAQRAA